MSSSKLGRPPILRGILGILARKMGGIPHLMAITKAARNTLTQWAAAERDPSPLTAESLNLLSILWGVQPVVYDRSRPHHPALPSDHIIVNSPDGWWILEKGRPWLVGRKPYDTEVLGKVSGLIPASTPDLPGYSIPRHAATLPEQLVALPLNQALQDPLAVHAHLTGIAEGLLYVQNWTPPSILEALHEACVLSSSRAPQPDPRRSLLILREAATSLMNA